MRGSEKNTTQNKINKLLKDVEENAMHDRTKAVTLFLSIDSEMEEKQDHIMYGQQAMKYLEIAGRANDQLMRVAALTHKIEIDMKKKSHGVRKGEIESILEEISPGILNEHEGK